MEIHGVGRQSLYFPQWTHLYHHHCAITLRRVASAAHFRVAGPIMRACARADMPGVRVQCLSTK